MGTSIRALLLSQMDSFTPSEQKVAQALLDRYPSLGLGPIASFAKQAEVSDPTVFRFVVRIVAGRSSTARLMKPSAALRG